MYLYSCTTCWREFTDCEQLIAVPYHAIKLWQVLSADDGAAFGILQGIQAQLCHTPAEEAAVSPSRYGLFFHLGKRTTTALSRNLNAK